MTDGLQQDVIKEIEVVHRGHFSSFGENRSRDARMVVWAVTSKNQKVWLLNVEGNLDSLDIQIKTILFKQFFSRLINHEIEFESKGDFLFAKNESLPKEFLLPYEQIKQLMWDWVKENHQQDLIKINQEKASKASATRKANADIKAMRLAEKLKRAIWLSFEKGFDPKHKKTEWKTRFNRKIFVLDHLDIYDPLEKKVPVEKIKELGNGVVLVRRIK